MNRQFLISKNLFNFVVTVRDNSVKIETHKACEYIPAFNYISAETQELMIKRYLKRYGITKNVFEEVMSFYSDRLWSIEEVSQGCLEEINQSTGCEEERI